jgi:uracil-DNA glycosylase family 4
MDALGRLHAEIRACTRCVARGYIERAQPIVEGKATDRIVIIGQAPGIVELAVNHPFSGRSGVTLRAWLAEAGIPEDRLPYRTSITKCFPGKAASGAGDRRPSPAEIALCVPFLERELEIVRPEVVVLLGQLAIERFWGRAALDEAVGKSRRVGDRVYIPLPHPSGASRWLNEPTNRTLLRRGLRMLRREAARVA